MAKLNGVSHYPAKVRVDGTDVNVQLARLALEEFVEFEHKFLSYGDAPGEQPADIKKTPESEAAELAKAQELVEWTQSVYERYVTFAQGEIDMDSKPVLSGTDFLRWFGSRTTLVMQIINLLWASNKLPEEMVKEFASPSDFSVISAAQAREALGPKQETIAESAEPGASAGIEAATTVRPNGE